MGSGECPKAAESAPHTLGRNSVVMRAHPRLKFDPFFEVRSHSSTFTTQLFCTGMTKLCRYLGSWAESQAFFTMEGGVEATVAIFASGCSISRVCFRRF